MLAQPIISDLNSASDRYAQRGFRYGNGLIQSHTLDAQGRLIAAGNAQVGLLRLGYHTADSPSERMGRTAANPSAVHLSRRVGPGQVAAAENQQTVLEHLRHMSQQRLNSPPDTQDNAAAVAAPPPLIRFDHLGREIARGDLHFIYDSLNRLIAVQRIGSNGKATQVARYRYNPFGQRIAKTVYDDGTPRTTYFIYDGTHLVAEADANGRIGNQYVWLNDKPIALLNRGQIGYILTDNRNAPLAITDQNRRVVWQANVEAGLLTQPLMPQAGASLQALSHFNLRGSNQYYDAETGLHYNTNRYYDPTTGRYLTPDPKGLAVGPDLYTYALNHPYSFTDPLGLAPINSNADVPNASSADKLQFVFTRAAQNLPGDIGQALLDMVSPTSLATTAGVFAVWAIAQASPAGWAADVVVAGIGYYFLGNGIYTVLNTFVDTAIAIHQAQCLSDLNNTGDLLSKGLSDAAISVGGGAIAAGAPKISKLIRKLLKKPPSGDVPPPPKSDPTPPPPPPVVSLKSLVGKTLFGSRLTNIGKVKNDGQLGESVAAQVLTFLTGKKYKGIHNGSGNGPDLISINPATKTIEHVEVKSSQIGAPGWPDPKLGTPDDRFWKWIAEAATGYIAKKPISTADEAWAQEILKLKGIYKLDNKVMQVHIPLPKGAIDKTTGKPSTGEGNPTMKLSDWK